MKDDHVKSKASVYSRLKILSKCTRILSNICAVALGDGMEIKMYNIHDKSSAIRAAKEQLFAISEKLYPQVPRTTIDGFYDDETRAAVKEYQKIKGLKESGEMIGDCGITMQNIDGELLPEIGYHIRKDCQKKGYGSEAAAECIKYGFSELHFPALYSYMTYTNIPSARVAQKNGMSFVREYEDRENTVTKVYSISREEWENGRKASE